MAMTHASSTVTRRQLGRKLRQLRELAGKTEADVEAARLVSRSKLWRIETGKSPVRVADARALCWLYGTDQQTTDALATLAFGTTDPGWWDEYGDASPGYFRLYVGLEEMASRMLRYEAELVYGLFQTPEYARALYEASKPGRKGDHDELLRQRLKRQEVLGRMPPPRISVVLNAAVFARQVGGARVMAGQIAHLRELARRPNIEIRVLPWEAGAHAAVDGAFTVVDFDGDDDPSVAYYDTLTEARYLEKPRELAAYPGIFESIVQQSVSLEEYL